MSLRRPFRILAAAAIAVAIVILAIIAGDKSARWESVSFMILGPGLLVANLIWPDGVHSGSGLSAFAVWWFFATIYASSSMFWMTIINLMMKRLLRVKDDATVHT